MTDTTTDTERLLACLTDVTELDGGRWRASTLGLPGGHIFGGQMIGQSISVAARLQPDKLAKSLRIVFPRGATDPGTLEYDAEVLGSGKAYATSSIRLSQPGRDGTPTVRSAAHVIHHAPAPGVDHQAAMPDVPPPAECRESPLGIVPWETRVVGDTDLNERRAQPNRLQLWWKSDVALPDDQAAHQALLAFASELTLIGTAILPHAEWSQLDAHVALRTSVIAHDIQFHRPFRLDDWLLLSQTSPVAAQGSAYGSGQVFTGAGELVATITQESMIRVAEPPA